MTEKEEAKKLSPKVRVWVYRETHEKVKQFAETKEKKLIDSYKHLVDIGTTLSSGSE